MTHQALELRIKSIDNNQQIQGFIKRKGLKLLHELSSDDPNYTDKITDILLNSGFGYILVLIDHAGPEDDIRY